MGFQRVRRCKTVTFDNFRAISRATALEHHSANQFLKAATNLNVVQPKLFQASRQDDLRFSDCTVSVIQILDDADAAFRFLGAGLRTVLSVTTMFADKPHHLNGRTSAERFCVLTILPPVTALAIGLPAQRAIAQRFRAMALLGHVSFRFGADSLLNPYFRDFSRSLRKPAGAFSALAGGLRPQGAQLCRGRGP